MSRGAKKTRATTQHRDRIKSYHKKLEVQNQPGQLVSQESKRARIMSSKPSRLSNRNMGGGNERQVSNNSDLNLFSGDQMSGGITSTSGYLGINALSNTGGKLLMTSFQVSLLLLLLLLTF